MPGDWVMLPIEQLVRSRSRGVLKSEQCALCDMQTVSGMDHDAAEQVRLHLERHHEAVAETATNRTAARLRRKLTAMGWTPPADGTTEQPDPDRRPVDDPAVRLEPS